jgi:hypothetical protein
LKKRRGPIVVTKREERKLLISKRGPKTILEIGDDQ